ncbi:MAG: hypothetical protein HY084_04875 [Gemmatimonadetes bacterium]|nr:hypothetical protein [Gemmatimonadota bacterium]
MRAGAPKAEPAKGSRGGLALTLIVLPLLAINIGGAQYYFADLGERVRHPWHAWLRPSGYIGQSAGLIALLVFVFLWLYPLRKKWKALAFTGSVGKWLDVHVTTAMALPLLLAIHAAWRSDGVIGLGLAAMLIVCASGIVGRYLYVRIPRAKSGVELTRDEVAAQRRELIVRLAEATGTSVNAVEELLTVSDDSGANENPLRVLGRLLTNDLMRWKRSRDLRRRWAAASPDGHPIGRAALRDAVRLADREMSLTQQTRMLEATHRVFRYWHVAHRPFAITALVAVVIHVVVVVAVGATWLR